MTDEASLSWFERHWKWLIPAGCLGSLLVVVAWGVFIVLFIFAGMKTSGAYQDAVDSHAESSAK